MFNAATKPTSTAHIHLTDADLDQWRSDVVFGAHAGDQALTDAAIDQNGGDWRGCLGHLLDQPGPAALDDLVDWQPEPANRSSLPLLLIFGGGGLLYFGGHILFALTGVSA